jgi:hypothetical protein
MHTKTWNYWYMLHMHTKTDAVRPHGQRGKHLTHTQQQGHAHQQWHSDHSDHSRPSLIQNNHSQKYNMLSQTYILHRTMCASRCHVYDPKKSANRILHIHNCQGLLPLDPTRSSPAPSTNCLPVPPFLEHLFTQFKKNWGKKWPAFFAKRQDLVRKRYINCSRLTAIGDTLGDSWRMYNNQLFNSTFKRWHFRWFLKYLQ